MINWIMKNIYCCCASFGLETSGKVFSCRKLLLLELGNWTGRLEDTKGFAKPGMNGLAGFKGSE